MRYYIFFALMMSFYGCSSGTNETTQEYNNTNPLFVEQWSIHYDADFYRSNLVDADAHINPQNLLQTYTGKGVKVAVIDDGFDITHPELKDKIIATISVDAQGNVGSDVGYVDSASYHGTATTGIIAAANNNIGMMGIAPDVELILIKMPQDVDDVVLMKLFTQAIYNGADVINCSWGTGEVSDSFREFMQNLDAVVLFASGNGNANMGNDESAISSVIGVGATDKDNLRTSYSDYGKDLDIVAPGGYALGITALDAQGVAGASEDDYIRYDERRNGSEVSFIGTSASAPIMSGVVALALQKNPNLTPTQVREILQISTTYIGNNTPYLDNMISASSQTPIISGIYGKTPSTELKVQLTSHATGQIYGLYTTESTGNNEWQAAVTDTLSEGNYTIEVVSSDKKTIWATDESFEINNSLPDKIDKSR